MEYETYGKRKLNKGYFWLLAVLLLVFSAGYLTCHFTKGDSGLYNNPVIHGKHSSGTLFYYQAFKLWCAESNAQPLAGFFVGGGNQTLTFYDEFDRAEATYINLQPIFVDGLRRCPR